MIKKRFLSLLVLLAAVVTGAWADPTTHVVTPSTVDDIFSGDGYTLGNAVSAGDVLDFRGEIDLQHSLIVNKQVNIKSSTKDAVVKLNTPTSGTSYSATVMYPQSFVINKAGSGTTVQDIRIENTETWIYNTSNVTFTGVTFHVEEARVGSSVGHLAVRYSDNVKFDGCTIYTKDNGGSSSFVLTGSSNCTVENCTILSEGSVGNPLVLGNTNSSNDKPNGFSLVNDHNTVKNCTINAPISSMCRVNLCGKYGLLEGNTITCDVSSGFGAVAPTSFDERITYRNNTIGGNLSPLAYSTVEGNTVAGTLSGPNGSVLTGNTVGGNVTIGGANVTFTDNNVFGKLTSSQKGATITGNTIVVNQTYAISLSSTAADANNKVQNNVLMAATNKGDAAVESKSTSNTVSDNKSEATTADGLTWTFDFAAKTLVIGGTGAMADYEATASGQTTALWAFLSALTERIVVGEGVTAIGANAFAGFAGVNSVIANGATPPSLGSGAFDTNATIAAYVPAGTIAAYQSAWGASVASIADYMSCGTDAKAIYDASTKTLTIAGYGAMTDFASAADQPWKTLQADIETVVIENTVTAIGDNAFNGCSALSAVYVEGSGVTVGTDAFSGNADGRKIFVPVANVIDYTANWTAYAADIRSTGYCGAEGNETDVVWEFNANTMGLTISGTGPMADTSYNQWSAVRTSIESATIEPGVTTIGNSAFASCSKLAAVSIPSSVTSIGSNVFSTCTALLSVSIPSSVTTIGNTAFQKCSKLTTVNIPDGVTSIGNNVFQDCSELTAITIPDKVTSIGQYAFQNCSKLTTVNIPDGVTSIGQYAFDGCTLLTAINIPASVANFGNYAFRNCSNLTTVNIPDGVTSIGQYAFEGCTLLTAINIPASVATISNYAFRNCSNLTAITIAEGVSSIGNYTFQSCSKLESVSFPASVTSIGMYSFRYCSKLAKVYIYAPSLTKYGDDAFKNNAEGRKIYVPAGSVDTYKAEWSGYAADIEAIALALSETTDNSAALTEWDGYKADVTLTRTLSAGSWNTFAAPFSTAIPDGWTLKELTSAKFADGTLTLNFATAASIEAGKPYLVKVTADTDLSTEPFTGAIVSKDAQPFTSTDVDFIPTLGATTIEGSDTKAVLFLAANNTLLNPSALPANMKGFRAYFQLKGDAVNAASFNLDLGDGETTGIIAIGTDRAASTDNATYTLDGRCISKATQKGVYIQNGKKVIIK